ncbi:MAG: RpiB/LacA/LacB family sugar-phosphate isomerase [Acidimicrobiia bacterium]
MRVAVGADEPCALVDAVSAFLEAGGHEVARPAPIGSVWTDVGRSVGKAVAEGRADLGVVVCWTGTGVSIAANKVPGVRAALCVDAETATGARRWNDANVLALSQRLTTPAVGEEILAAFLAAAPDDDERPTIARLG